VDWFLFVNEAHFIITAGELKAGEKFAFHAAYGKLAEVLVQLPRTARIFPSLSRLEGLIIQAKGSGC
jgi:uncharacterized protein (UPF0128 family)